MMKKFFAIALSMLLCAPVLAGCADTSAPTDDTTTDTTDTATDAADDTASDDTADTAAGDTLTLFTWEGMFPPEVLDGFTEETGIEINYASFDFDETMYAKLEAAGGGDYDLVIADDYIIETVIDQGLAQKLDTSKLENFGNINPVYQSQFFDETNEYTVPYGAGLLTIAYDPAVVDMEITSYEDLWDASLEDNIGIIGNYRVINGMALKVLGESYNTDDVAKIEEAGALLNELAPNIRLIKDDNTQDDLLSGEVGAAVMYTSQVTLAKLANPEIEVVFPEEGLGFGIMASFIPSEAPNSEGAHLFLDYLLQPEISAQCTEWVGYYSTNTEADALINPEYSSFLTLPEDVDASTAEMIQNISADAEAAHTKAWTEFKTACE